MKNQKQKAIIPAAGPGTRFLPATKALAKEAANRWQAKSIQFIASQALKSGNRRLSWCNTGKSNVLSMKRRTKTKLQDCQPSCHGMITG